MSLQITLAQQTADKILNYIVENKLKPGDKLPTEKELMPLICVSRSVLREALGILTTMHVLETIQGSGIYLTSPDTATMLNSYQAYMKLGYANIDDMYEIWIRLEAASAALAAERATSGEIALLRQCNDELKQSMFQETAFKEIDERFHSIIADCTGNTLLIMNLRSLAEIVSDYRHLTLRYLDIRKDAFKCHTKILEAIAERNPAMAQAYMTEHLTNVKQSADFYNLFVEPKNEDGKQ